LSSTQSGIAALLGTRRRTAREIANTIGKIISMGLALSDPARFLEYDASGIGLGRLCHVSIDHPCVEAHGFFLDLERAQSSTHRELNGMLFILRSLASICTGRGVQVLVDNQNISRLSELSEWVREQA
jgi:hypothetical protein